MFLAYARSRSFGWVYDDIDWLPLWDHPMAWGPMTFAYWPFALADWSGGGLPWSYHGLIVVLHLLNGVLFWFVMRSWLSESAALVALALFWLHPMQTQAVAYVTGGREVLLTVYLLLAYVGLRSDRWLAMSAGVLCLVLGATVKPSAAPAVVLVAAAAFIGRGWFVRAVGLACGIVLASAVVSVIWFQVGELTSGWLERYAAAQTVALALWRYMALVVWPVGFSIVHDWTVIPAAVGVMALIATGGAAYVVPRLAWLWIVGLTMPRALIPNAPPLAEQHTYLPFLAVWWGAGLAVDRLSERTAHGY